MRGRLRVLVLDAKYPFLNPTWGLVASTLALHMDVSTIDLIGLEGSTSMYLEALERQVSHCDVVLVADVLANRPIYDLGPMHQGLTRIVGSDNAARVLERLGPTRELLEASRVPIVLSLLATDCYNMSLQQADDIGNFADALVVNWGPNDVKFIRDTPEIDREKFYPAATDHYATLLRQASARVAVIPHFVSTKEFSQTALAIRRDCWVVPGVHYDYRRQASSLLAQAGRLRRRSLMRHAYSAAYRLGVDPYHKEPLVRLMQRSFRKAIRASRYAYTCGSRQELLVRKHFEIPAMGTLLVSAPFASSDALGFVSGKNCVMAVPDELLEIDSWLRGNPSNASSIAVAGQQMVDSLHSTKARAEQWERVLQALVAGNFSGAGWQDGQFQLFGPGKP